MLLFLPLSWLLVSGFSSTCERELCGLVAIRGIQGLFVQEYLISLHVLTFLWCEQLNEAFSLKLLEIIGGRRHFPSNTAFSVRSRV